MVPAAPCWGCGCKMRPVAKRLIVWTHRLHRWTGTGLAVLMLVWFASGAVMTFAGYPAFTDEERLAHSQPLTAAAASAGRSVTLDDPAAPELAAEQAATAQNVVADQKRTPSRPQGLPPALEEWLAAGNLARSSARLSMIEGRARWILRDASRYHALSVTGPPWEVAPLDEVRARAEVERVHGACRGPAELVEVADQWTVGRSHPGSYPLLRFMCEDASASEVYISTRSGEIIQESTRSERGLAWVGPIAHWIYPAALRRERALWRDVVLWLSAVGCMVALTGLLAGVHSWLRSGRSAQRQRYLRWHQRIGLGFGLAAFAWVFSGALSLEPFHWASSDFEPAAAWSQLAAPPDVPLAAALERCGAELPELRELELVALGHLYAFCSDARADTRIIDLADPALTPRTSITDEQLQTLAQVVGAELTLAHAPDDYYYPTHRRPVVLPFARFALSDSRHTVLYVDPARAALLDQIDDKRRWERWLYHGLHSWDFQPLYGRKTLWQIVIVAAMLTGSALCLLGILIFTRRQSRRRQRLRSTPASRRSSKLV